MTEVKSFYMILSFNKTAAHLENEAAHVVSDAADTFSVK